MKVRDIIKRVAAICITRECAMNKDEIVTDIQRDGYILTFDKNLRPEDARIVQRVLPRSGEA